MYICPGCGEYVAIGETICPYCGYEIEADYWPVIWF